MSNNDTWERLSKPKFVVAPMVDASELAWRILCRNHGAQLCYTPMLHSSVFIRDSKYRTESMATCPQDRPLIVQFCANDSDTLAKAASYVESFCDCIDINLGCPQSIARRGHYGAFLQDEWDLLSRMVRKLRDSVSVPISCKIRIFSDMNKSIDYAKMLEAAGCQLLTVHGRTREQKGPLTGVASWAHIKAIKEAVRIPVISNGNTQCLNDALRCLKETGCDGIMSAEGILYNPALFEGRLYPVWELALEYLNLTNIYPCPLSYTRGHLFKLFQHLFVLPENEDLREEIGKGQNRNDFLKATMRIEERYKDYHSGKIIWFRNHTHIGCNLRLPPWICQPWVRMTPEDHLEKMRLIQTQSKKQSMNALKGEQNENSESEVLSKKKQKRLLKRKSAKPHSRQYFTKCILCPNRVGLKCENELCKTCCRKKCFEDDTHCLSHRIGKKVKTNVDRPLVKLPMIVCS